LAPLAADYRQWQIAYLIALLIKPMANRPFNYLAN